MNTIPEWIDKIIEDLVNPNIKLSDTLLTVQVLAFKIENSTLREWIESEISGYVGKDVPDYRSIPTATIGNLIQDAGFGRIATKNNTSLPVEYLDKDIREFLKSIKLDSSIAELEGMIEKNGSYEVSISHFICQEISKTIDPWQVSSAWQKINLNSIEGVLSTLKSTLLNFLLELNKEFGNNNNLSIMKNKKEISEIFNKTIGNISGKQVNITLGNNSVQTNNSGKKPTINIVAGKNTNLQIEIKNFLENIKENFEKLDLSSNDNEDISNEITRIEAQLKRDEPRVNIMETALNTINGILTSITANVYTPIVLEKLNQVINLF